MREVFNMKKCLITAETTCDLSEEIINARGFKLIPITVILDDKEYRDGKDLSADQLFDYINQTGKLPKTAALTEFEYEEFFNECKKESEKVIHFCISSKASSTYFNAVKAAEKVGDVFVVDTKALSTGEALLMLKASDLLDAGESPEAVYKKCVDLADKVQTSFVLDTLDYMHKGGRCSSVALIGAKILKIHPYIYEKEGDLVVKKKYMGTLSRSLNQYISDIATDYPTYDKTRAFVTHSPCDGREQIEAVIAQTKELFDFDEIIETEAGATVSTHCGKNTIGLLFITE